MMSDPIDISTGTAEKQADVEAQVYADEEKLSH